MLDDTILNNVTFNLIESEIDFNFFEKCLEEAQLLSFVNSLDEKSSTNIGKKELDFLEDRYKDFQLQELYIKILKF